MIERCMDYEVELILD